jgi:hypothetical protein
MAREGQEQHREQGDEIAGVAHPVVERALLARGRQQEPVGGIARAQQRAEGDVGDQSVHVERHPAGVPHRVGEAHQVSALVDAGRRHHEGRPGVGDEHHDGAEQVEQQA